MRNKKYIILNFLHGNSPYLRTLELALVVNDLLEKKGRERFGIIVPWVYKIRQKEIIKHNFRGYIKKYPDEILLDDNFEKYLQPIFYDGYDFGKWLENFLENRKKTEEGIKKYISGGLTAQNIKGKKFSIKREDVVMEINRCPLVDFGISPSYSAGFGYMSDILERASKDQNISLDKMMLKKTVPVFEEIEKKQTIRFIAEPATFSYLENRGPKYEPEILTPPNTNQKISLNPLSGFFIKRGAYVTITGVYGLNHLFEEMNRVGFKIYTHKLGVLPFARKALPDVITHKNILLHFARIGWGSAWLSFMTETPLITFPYDKKDEPEVYFNNICVEKLGIGKVYNGESIDELLEFGEQYKENAKSIKQNLMEKYGTLNGAEYTAEKIVNHYLKC